MVLLGASPVNWVPVSLLNRVCSLENARLDLVMFTIEIKWLSDLFFLGFPPTLQFSPICPSSAVTTRDLLRKRILDNNRSQNVSDPCSWSLWGTGMPTVFFLLPITNTERNVRKNAMMTAMQASRIIQNVPQIGAVPLFVLCVVATKPISRVKAVMIMKTERHMMPERLIFCEVLMRDRERTSIGMLMTISC